MKKNGEPNTNTTTIFISIGLTPRNSTDIISAGNMERPRRRWFSHHQFLLLHRRASFLSQLFQARHCLLPEDLETPFWGAHALWEWLLETQTRWYHWSCHCSKHWPCWSPGRYCSVVLLTYVFYAYPSILNLIVIISIFSFLTSLGLLFQTMKKWVKVDSLIWCKILWTKKLSFL